MYILPLKQLSNNIFSHQITIEQLFNLFDKLLEADILSINLYEKYYTTKLILEYNYDIINKLKTEQIYKLKTELITKYDKFIIFKNICKESDPFKFNINDTQYNELSIEINYKNPNIKIILIINNNINFNDLELLMQNISYQYILDNISNLFQSYSYKFYIENLIDIENTLEFLIFTTTPIAPESCSPMINAVA
jgi:hypothetical protein